MVQRDQIYVMFVAIDLNPNGVFYLTDDPGKAHNFGVIQVTGGELIEYNKAMGNYSRWQDKLRDTAKALGQSPRESDPDSNRGK